MSNVELEYMREAGQVVAAIHSALIEATAPGKTTAELDQVVAQVVARAGAKPNFLHYQGFPATVCISVNDEVVHGIPGSRTLQLGDIVSYDCGAYVVRDGKKWHGDAAVTVIVGDRHITDAGFVNGEHSTEIVDGVSTVDLERRRALSAVTRGSMWAGIAAVAKARRINDIGAAIEDFVDERAPGIKAEQGWTPEIIEGYTGHGIGNNLHEDPTVYNYRTRGRSPKVVPGMALCIEPMVIAGDSSSTVLDDDWTVVTIEGTDAAHWEHTVAIGTKGISVLTSPDAGATALAPYGITPITDFTV
ncbi:type I methionyl aminopeptidase [Actinomyces minihominis]|uniref:type I methionyl aminopeptidase n=1 Tax=Actinomyces minihominis TaxID=2002838 RepID=UPI000C08A6CC|nr:methionyl aminopeptidase [Actinomyces minihominis]